MSILRNGLLPSISGKTDKFRPIAHFAWCAPSQTCIPTGVLRGSNVSECKSMVENAQ